METRYQKNGFWGTMDFRDFCKKGKFIGDKRCIWGVWTSIWCVWTCILGVWTYILGFWTCTWGVWTRILGV